MAISRKRDFARMIAMMVRKESVTFEPSDRIPLDVKRKTGNGSLTDVSVGEVYYDFDSGRMCYKLFSASGVQMTRPSGPLFLDEDLTSAELARVGSKVSDYVERSIGRGKAIGEIEQMVYDAPEMSVKLDDKLRLFVDVYRDGRLVPFFPEVVYDSSWSMEDRREVLLSGKTAEGKNINIPLLELSDMSVSAVHSAVQSRLDRTEKTKVGMTEKKAGEEKRTPHPAGGPKL